MPQLHPRDPAALRATVTGITHDSREVRPGDLYLARAGEHTHGIDHLPAALAAGAAAVLTDPQAAGAVPAEVPVLVAADPRSVAGDVAAWVYGDPASGLLTFGVTGTNGKTTTAWLIDAGLRGAGRRTGLVGTVATVVDGTTLPSARTTPEATDLQALLAVMRERGVTAATLEVSSHALALGRVAGCRFDVAGFTNLSQDHLDFHGDIEAYFAAKAALFTPQYADRGVVTVDDDWGRRMAEGAAVPVDTLTSAPAAATWTWEAVTGGLRLSGPSGPLTVPVALPGRFNLANAALAAAMLLRAGLPGEAVSAGIGGLDTVPGRMQRVEAGQDFTVLVDYAHTPEAVARVLREARALVAPGAALTVVLGCGGDRDRAKRPLMGEAAARGADRVVVTDDNPRSEDPAAIRAAVLAGAARGAAAVIEVADRRAAIEHALRSAGAGDVVVLAGKGHEAGQEIAGTTHPFDDATVAAGLLHARSSA